MVLLRIHSTGATSISKIIARPRWLVVSSQLSPAAGGKREDVLWDTQVHSLHCKAASVREVRATPKAGWASATCLGPSSLLSLSLFYRAGNWGCQGKILTTRVATGLKFRPSVVLYLTLTTNPAKLKIAALIFRRLKFREVSPPTVTCQVRSEAEMEPGLSGPRAGAPSHMHTDSGVLWEEGMQIPDTAPSFCAWSPRGCCSVQEDSPHLQCAISNAAHYP